MIIEVDVTKFRVQPFRSYKVCISLEDYTTDSYLDEVCTHLFSFEKYVPYVPEEEEKKDIVDKDINKNTQDNHIIVTSTKNSNITSDTVKRENTNVDL